MGDPLAVALVAYGSRGDVQPMAELGRALAAAGHRPRLFAAPDEARLGPEAGVPTTPVGAALRPYFARPFSMRDPRRMLAFMGFLAAQIEPMSERLAEAWSADRPDLVLATGVTWGAPIAAERLGLRYGFVALSPALIPSGAFPPPLLPGWSLPPGVNRALWRVAERVVEARVRPAVDRARASFGRGPVANVHAYLLGRALLVAADPELAPLPDDLPVPARAIGFRARPSGGASGGAPGGGALAPELERFLADGPAPLWIGMGSMNEARPTALAAMLVAAAREAGLRVILGRGWGRLDPGRAAPDVLVVDDAPHEALFPRVVAAVHHGGAGTVATAARAGIPQLVWPHILDQPYWAGRVERLGIGVRLPTRLTARALSRALAAALTPAVRGRARALADRLADPARADPAVATVATFGALA